MCLCFSLFPLSDSVTVFSCSFPIPIPFSFSLSHTILLPSHISYIPLPLILYLIKIGAASTLDIYNEHRGRPGFPAMCWRNPSILSQKKSQQVEDQKVEIKSDKQPVLNDKQDENNITSTIREKKLSDISIVKNEIKDEEEDTNLFVKNEFKILDDNAGSIFVIEASIKGAFF